jgi:nucleoside-diphosphate-sugar epimerase
MTNNYAKYLEQDMMELSSRVDISSMKDTTVLITGANGMLARYLVSFFMFMNQKYTYNIHVIATFRRNNFKEYFKQYISDKFFTFIVQDVCIPLVLENKIDYIIQAAGSASPEAIVNDPVGILKANAIGNFAILELAKEKNVKKVLYLSTREVYGKVLPEIKNITEKDIGALDPLDERSCYPEGKRAGEAIYQAYHKQYNVPFSIVRIAHSYGPGMTIDNDGRVMSDIIGGAVHHSTIKFNSNGSAERAFCYISDAVSAIIIALLKGTAGEAYNIANETESFSIKDVAEMLIDIFPERNIKLILNLQSEYSRNSGYSKITRVALDTSKIEKLGWSPKIGLKDGLKRTVSSFL